MTEPNEPTQPDFNVVLNNVRFKHVIEDDPELQSLLADSRRIIAFGPDALGDKGYTDD